MKNWIRYGWPRRHIVRIAAFLWPGTGTPAWLLNFLYPDDMVIAFAKDEAEQ